MKKVSQGRQVALKKEIEIPYKILGENIQMLREAKGITQQDLAERMGYTTNYQSQIECGRCRICLARLIQLSLTLETPLEQIVNGCTIDVLKDMNEGKQLVAEDRGRLIALINNCTPEQIGILLIVARGLCESNKTRKA